MTSKNALGLLGLYGVHYYVRDLERSRRFYTGSLDFAEIGHSCAALERDGRQRSLVFQGGSCVIVCSTPEGAGGRAARYLSRHPDGIGTLAFEVEDIEHTFTTLDRSGGNPISEIQTFRDGAGWLKTFSITTPFGDTTFRFVQRKDYAALFPGMELYREPTGGNNVFGFRGIDHVTSNFQTMSPALLWLEHVMGFQRFWDVEFHTRDAAKDDVHAGEQEAHGSGLRSRVMWEPSTGIKFANNEPYRPAFKSSQINVFHEENRGDGVQHIALSTGDILGAVRGLRARGVEFMPTPDSYYELLPARLERTGVGRIDEDIDQLRELGILVDGEGPRNYLLQIFLKDSAGLYGSSEAGPFFFELIQRKGDQGFGAGNFRALFESIEREQSKAAPAGDQGKAETKVSTC
jgi:4-hydroxyphenylpyruvate dioxygenase